LCFSISGSRPTCDLSATGIKCIRSTGQHSVEHPKSSARRLLPSLCLSSRTGQGSRSRPASTSITQHSHDQVRVACGEDNVKPDRNQNRTESEPYMLVVKTDEAKVKFVKRAASESYPTSCKYSALSLSSHSTSPNHQHLDHPTASIRNALSSVSLYLYL